MSSKNVFSLTKACFCGRIMGKKNERRDRRAKREQTQLRAGIARQKQSERMARAPLFCRALPVFWRAFDLRLRFLWIADSIDHSFADPRDPFDPFGKAILDAAI